MIVYELVCGAGHKFEGWFASSSEFERQRDAKLLACPTCSNDRVERVPHASYVNRGTSSKTPEPREARANKHYANVDAEALAKLVSAIVEKTDDVGSAFPEEARRIHYREAPARHIRGTASHEEVEALREEGIEVVALPVSLQTHGKVH